MTNISRSPWAGVVAALKPTSITPDVPDNGDDKFKLAMVGIDAACAKATFKLPKPLIPTHDGYVVVLARSAVDDHLTYEVIDDLDLTVTAFRRAVVNLMSRWRNLARLGVGR